MSLTVYIPGDSASISMGANRVADELTRLSKEHSLDLTIVRNSSYGLFWLEPLLEVQTRSGRVAFGPVAPTDIEDLFRAGVFHRNGFAASNLSNIHPLCLGLTEHIPYLRKQKRLTFSRIGIGPPCDLNNYLELDGFKGLKQALGMSCEKIVQTVINSGLRGRGGAAFPTGLKWQTVLQAASLQKYIVCNADEGDSGSYSDRMILEGDPFLVLEGMIIAGLATGATEGYIYIRSEYPKAYETLQIAIAKAEQAGYLGHNILDSGQSFNITLRKAAGSYVCGEETAMLESLEGKRGIVRAKPPLPAIQGLFNQPTVINNVISLASVANILAQGAAAYSSKGSDDSRGTLPFQLAGNIKRGGLIEVPFGITLRELVFGFGGGTASGRPVKAIQVGGPLGSYIPAKHWDVPMTYGHYKSIGATLGHGGIVVHDDSVNMARLARYAMTFCALESCGKCTPCRIGSTRGVEIIDHIRANQDRANQVALLRDLCDTMTFGSLCAMGGMTPNPVLSALNYYPQDFGLNDD